jgi:hypothetical protein
LLESVPLGVTTSTVPVVAPAGTVVVISASEARVSFVPKILTATPTLPEPGSVLTNGPNPTDSTLHQRRAGKHAIGAIGLTAKAI